MKFNFGNSYLYDMYNYLYFIFDNLFRDLNITEGLIPHSHILRPAEADTAITT